MFVFNLQINKFVVKYQPRTDIIGEIMKKKLLIINLALFLAADMLVTGFILHRANKKAGEVPVFTPPTTTVSTETTTSTDETEYKIVETVPEETVTEPTEQVAQSEIGTIVTDTTMYAAASPYALDIKNLTISDNVYKILSDINGYDLVRTDSNNIGFIKSEDIEYTGETVDAPYEITLKNDIVVTTTNLNYRYGPSTEYESFRILEEETELQVIGETENGWLLVHLNGEVGFVSKKYTYSVLHKINERYPDLNLEELNVQKVVEVRNGTNYRKGPSTDDEIIREFSKSETMRVLGEYDGWYFGITDDYDIGFVSKNYTTDLNGIFIDTDILTQRMRMYNENQLLYYTRVKTGKDSTPTDEGHFKIFWMGEDVNIVDDIVVNYWMNYNNGEGIHDLESCTSFGEDDYHWEGSNGCTRTPLENVSKIYQKASVGTPVIVHK